MRRVQSFMVCIFEGYLVVLSLLRSSSKGTILALGKFFFQSGLLLLIKL